MKEGRVKRGGAPLLPWLNNMSFSQLGPGKRRGKGRRRRRKGKEPSWESWSKGSFEIFANYVH